MSYFDIGGVEGSIFDKSNNPYYHLTAKGNMGYKTSVRNKSDIIYWKFQIFYYQLPAIQSFGQLFQGYLW